MGSSLSVLALTANYKNLLQH